VRYLWVNVQPHIDVVHYHMWIKHRSIVPVRLSDENRQVVKIRETSMPRMGKRRQFEELDTASRLADAR
jgi:hypothetical protein